MAPPATVEYTIAPAVWSGREVPGRGCGHGGGIEHQRGGVVEQGLALQDGQQPAGQAQPPGELVAAAAASVGPTAVPSTKAIGHDRCPTRMGGGGHREGGGHHQQDGEHPDGTGVSEEGGRRGGDGGVVDQEREQPEEHHLGFEGHIGHEGQEADDQAGDDQDDRRRDPGRRRTATAHQGDRGDAEDDE